MRFVLAVLIGLSSPAFGEYMQIEAKRNPQQLRNAPFRPLANFFLPGFTQYFDGQIAEGVSYSLVGAGGFALGTAASNEINNTNRNSTDLEDATDAERQYQYGMQLYMFAGEMSVYHAFRTAAQGRKQLGQYTFIRNEDTTLDAMWAPFEVEHITKMTTWIPLLVLAVASVASVKSGDYMNFGDSAFTGGVSYNAGVGEEALFRGYFMPVLRENMDSYFWANAIQAVAFGAAHYGESNRFPWPQGLMGFYFGWMTHRNGYSIREAAFLHTWWDVLAIGFTIAHENGKKVAATRVPLLNISF
jgi:hypothetical protein